MDEACSPDSVPRGRVLANVLALCSASADTTHPIWGAEFVMRHSVLELTRTSATSVLRA